MRHRPFAIMLPILVLAALSACRDGTPGREPPIAGNATEASRTPPAPPTPAPSTSPGAIVSKDERLDYQYHWPSEAAAIPALDQWLRAHAAQQRKEPAEDAARDSNLAKQRGYPFRQHSFVQRWSTVADTPALLVLQAEGYEFTGGAHGMPFIATLIWDKAAGRRRATTDLLDVAALTRAARDDFCKALDAQRAEKRGAPVDPGAEGGIAEFVRCVDMARQEIVPVSRGGRTLDTIRAVILPYEAGPYAEGIYTIDLPMNDALRAAVKPGWRGAFAPSS